MHLIIANALHRRMTEAEMKRMVGEKIFDAYYPDRYYNHDAEDPDGMVELERTAHDEVVAINRRAAESDLLIYVNINLVPDGRRAQVGGHGPGELRVAAARTTTRRRSATPRATWSPSASALHTSTERIGRVIDKNLKVFHIETALNNRMFDGPIGVPGEEGGGLHRVRPAEVPGHEVRAVEAAAARRSGSCSCSIPAPYEVTGVHAGATEPTPREDAGAVLEAVLGAGGGPERHRHLPACRTSRPYNVNSILNPLLVQVMGLGYLFNLNRGVPLVKKGGVIILCHPAYDEFDPEHHPSYIEFFNRLLPETRDAMKLEHKYEREFAENPSYVHLYRKGNAYHGAHPFYMWYWGENGRQHVGKVDLSPARRTTTCPSCSGWDRTDTLAEAIDEARGFMGRSASITCVKTAPIVQCDVRL